MSSNTAAATATTGASASGGSASATTISIPATAALGGITITNPAATAAASFYKIATNQYITFGWNMTSVYATPTSLTLVASASGGNTYPISTIPGTATEIVWSPYEVEQTGTVPFAASTYTMSIWDDRGPKATNAAGYMSVNVGLVFALYRPQTYTDLSSWTCATCSGASSVYSNPGLLLFLTTTMAMLVSGWSLLRRAGGGRGSTL
ncbi:hypothetical protein BDY24DRAFT_375343 [Mrakia frigida]|uniref:uncharacterized protein n=1 Tax=Mrakia frigida TaxID=29902 RepID=UPI003FCC0198